MSIDATLIREIKQVSTDLKTKSVFSLGSDLPMVGDALERLATVAASFDARLTALEKARATPTTTSGSK